jgi:DNA-binding transcriptional LysR family regulator
MVSAGLGVSVLQVVDPRVCEQYPVKTIRLGASPPTLQLSVVTRKDDADSRLLLAVREALSLALKTTRP